jgi:acetyl-CoA acetyltransferase
MRDGPINVAILGTGMTRFGRLDGEDLRSLSETAVSGALADAGLQPGDVQLVLFGNAVEGVMHGQEMIRGEVALRRVGLHGVPMINVENACASSTSAFQLAVMAVMAGTADVVLVVGAEKLTHPDKRRSFAALATAVDLYEHTDLAEQAQSIGAPAADGTGHSPLMDLYAAKTRAFMAETGATVEDLAQVSVKNRQHAARNPLAHFRTGIDRETVLGSRIISDPLRLLMCAPVTDGGAAVVVTSAEYARRSGRL